MSSVLTPWRLQLGAMQLGVTDDAGVEWFVESVTGYGSPRSTLLVEQKPRAHGGWSGAAFLTPRTLAVGGWILAPTEALMLAAVDQLIDAVSLDPVVMTVTQGGVERTLLVRRSDEVIITHPAGPAAAQFSFQVVADDPRKYAPAALTGSTFLPSSSGGLTWPITWPLIWTGVAKTGQVSLFNAGNTEAPIRMRVFGPVTGPIISHQQSGKSLSFAPGFSVALGNYIDIDMERREVMENGQATRNGSLIGRGWFGLVPGQNDIAFSAAVYNAASALTVTSWSAWE